MVGLWSGCSSIPSYFTKTPTAIHGGAGSHTWSDSHWGSGSGAMVGSVFVSGSGSFIMAGMSSQSVVGSGLMSMHWGDDWLGPLEDFG